MTGPPLDDLRRDFFKAQKAAARQNADSQPVGAMANTFDVTATQHLSQGVDQLGLGSSDQDDEDDGHDTPPTSPEPDVTGNFEEESDSEDEMIKGVFWDDGTGNMVELDEAVGGDDGHEHNGIDEASGSHNHQAE